VLTSRSDRCCNGSQAIIAEVHVGIISTLGLDHFEDRLALGADGLGALAGD
jgi:hypothetical protein